MVRSPSSPLALEGLSLQVRRSDTVRHIILLGLPGDEDWDMTEAGAFTVEDFGGTVQEVIEASRTFPGRSLDEFLRAVWASFTRHKAEAPAWFLFAQLMKDGLTAPPAPYDERWSGFTKGPGNPWLSRPDIPDSHLPASLRSKNLEAERRRTTEIQVFEETLLFLISDLNSMLRTGSAPSVDGLSWDSPRGHRWQHWELAEFLDAAERGLWKPVEDGWIVGTSIEQCGWAALAVFLHLGMVYE